MKKTSLADIAKSLGVSKTLVSMVLNNRGDENGISPNTQKKVWAKAKELNYKPNKFARGLRMGRSNTIGLIVSDISNIFYATICRAVEDLAAQKGYQLMICSSDEKADREKELIQTLREWQVDGIILSTTQESNDEIIDLKKQEYPFVLIDRRLPRIDTDYIVVDNMQGARDATKHLIDHGHQKVGLLTISPSHISSMAERTKGYKQALKDAGIRFNNNIVREIPFDDVKNAVAEQVAELMKPPHNITALFLANNNLTAALLEWAKETNVRIPEDLAIISFDDVDMFRFCHPPVSAVAQPVEEIGRQAVRVLIERIESKLAKPAPQHVVLPTSLKVRSSCGAESTVAQ